MTRGLCDPSGDPLSGIAKTDHLAVCVSHVVSHRVTVNVQRATDVRMTHQALLHTYRSSDRIQPRAERVP